MTVLSVRVFVCVPVPVCVCTCARQCLPVCALCVCVQASFLSDSTILRGTDAVYLWALCARLSKWVAGLRGTALVYRASRDGPTPRAYHAACGGHSPALTLIRSDNGCVFGGYTDTGGDGEFLFSVLGPTGAMVRFPRDDAHAHTAGAGVSMGSVSGVGPAFGPPPHDVCVCNGSGRGGDPFDGHSYTAVGFGFVDTTGSRGKALTGSYWFTPTEVEVYTVKVDRE